MDEGSFILHVSFIIYTMFNIVLYLITAGLIVVEWIGTNVGIKLGIKLFSTFCSTTSTSLHAIYSCPYEILSIGDRTQDLRCVGVGMSCRTYRGWEGTDSRAGWTWTGPCRPRTPPHRSARGNGRDRTRIPGPPAWPRPRSCLRCRGEEVRFRSPWVIYEPLLLYGVRPGT